MNRLNSINELIATMNDNHSQARERIEKLFDENSFVELGNLNKNAGVVTGYGTISGKLVYAYSQEAAVDTAHAKKIDNIYDLAVKMGCPVIGIMDSKGLKLNEGLDAFDAYGLIFKNQTKASGVIPQISIVLGDCIGISSFMSVLSDFVIALENSSRMFMSSPAVFEGLDGKATSYNDLGGGKALASNGLAHCSGKTEEDCFDLAKRLISFLPENNLDMEVDYNAPVDDMNRTDEELNTIVPEDDTSPIDMKYIIRSVADNNDFFEIHQDFAPQVITGFVRFNGMTTGVIANNGLINVGVAQKAGEFINICDAFNMPVVTFTDTAGYEHTLEQERLGIVKYSAKLLYSFANATVPKVNVIVRNAVGNPYLLMNSKHIGADIVYSWPFACISLLDRAAATNVLKLSKEEFDKSTTPFDAAAKGYVDTVIIPSNTRKRILAALEMLMSKREIKPNRKHSSIEF